VYVALNTWNGSPSTSRFCGTDESAGWEIAGVGDAGETGVAEIVEDGVAGAEVLKTVLPMDFLGSGAFLQSSFFFESHAAVELLEDEFEADGGATIPTTGSVGLTEGATTAGTSGTVAGGTTTVAGAVAGATTEVTWATAAVAGAATDVAGAAATAVAGAVAEAAATVAFAVAPVVTGATDASADCPAAETLVDVCTTEEVWAAPDVDVDNPVC